MSSPRSGNQQRAEWRQRCREVLAQYLESQLGIQVRPEEVRLQPDQNDRYKWLRQPEKEHLFVRPLSKHSTGVYMELCREVGHSFEAVLDSNIKEPCKGLGFSGRITQLEAENRDLQARVAQYQETEAFASSSCVKLSAEVQNLRQDLEAAQESITLLTQNNLRLEKRARLVRNRVGSCRKEVEIALTALRRVKKKSWD